MQPAGSAQSRGQAHPHIQHSGQSRAISIISGWAGKRSTTVNRSTVKQGLYTPGAHLLIEPPERLLTDMPDYVLLLTWNFADEILAQQAEYRRSRRSLHDPFLR